MLPTNFWFILAKQFQRRTFFRNRPIRNKNCLWRPCLLTDRDKMSNFFRGSFIDASYQVSFHFGQAVTEQKIFRNQKQELPVAAMFLNESERYEHCFREPSIDASYQFSVHLAKRFQRRRIVFNWPIRNKNCLWRECLLMDQDKKSNLYRGPSIDASYQFSVHLAKWFQRRIFKKIDQSKTRIACGSHVY